MKVYSAQKVELSIKDFFSKCDQIRSFLRIASHLQKKSLMENFIFCTVSEAYSEPCQTSKIEGFAKIGNS